jgi:hypothetical protein
LAERINQRNTFKSFNLHRFTGSVSPTFALLRMTPAKEGLHKSPERVLGDGVIA